MSEWQKVLKEQSVATLEALAEKFGSDVIDVEALRPAFDSFQMRITPAALEQIRAVGDPMWQQYVPTVHELEIADGVVDSLNEDADSPVPNITHWYPDRALFLVSPVCASYCRFCTRRRKVGDPEKIPLNQYDSALAYLRAHTEIRDVIMSGGDPMLLSDRRLEYLFQQLRAIPHSRDHSPREPHHVALLPERITPEFCEMVQRYHPVYMNTHFNHPDELTPAAVAALDRLSKAGVPLGCQTVLLRGVNDDPAVMRELMHRLLKARVRPYYIYMCDPVAGGEHFRTTVQKGLEIIRSLRGWTSGSPFRTSSSTRQAAAARSRSCPNTSNRSPMTRSCSGTTKAGGSCTARRWARRQAQERVAGSGYRVAGRGEDNNGQGQ